VVDVIRRTKVEVDLVANNPGPSLGRCRTATVCRSAVRAVAGVRKDVVDVIRRAKVDVDLVANNPVPSLIMLE